MRLVVFGFTLWFWLLLLVSCYFCFGAVVVVACFACYVCGILYCWGGVVYRFLVVCLLVVAVVYLLAY